MPATAPRRTTPSAGSARKSATSARSIIRENAIGRVLVACATSVPLVAVTGYPGSGRSDVLAQVRKRLAEQQVPTVDFRLPREEHDVASLAERLADELGAPAHGNPMRRLHVALTGHRGRLVIFLDDAHRIKPESMTAVTAMLRSLVGTSVTFVCGVRIPAPVELEELRVNGLMREERLRPLSTSAVAQLLADRLGAEPAPGLAATVRNACRGIPAFVQAAIDGYLEAGCVRIVDRHAHLGGDAVPRLPVNHPLFAYADAPIWPVVKALAVLHPLGPAAPQLIADATGSSLDEVDDTLRRLRAGGVLLPGWRFRVPMVATLLAGCLGPFERRRIAQLAVTAIWSGTASAPPGYLPERLVDAGKLVDPERAADQLVASASAAGTELADRWNSAAARLITDPAKRAALLHRHAVTCALQQRFSSATETADTALRTVADEFSPGALQELQICYVVGLASSGNTAVLQEIAEDGMQGGEANRVVTRAAALAMLNRWQEAHDQLTGHDELWRGAGERVSAFAHVISRTAGVVLGVPPAVDGSRTDSAVEAARLLFPVMPPEPGELFRSGRWDEALDLARSSLAASTVHGNSPHQARVFREMAVILKARGQLSRARAILEDASAQHLLVPHLMTLPEAELETTIGANERAKELIEEELARAAKCGVTAGTDELWLWLAESESRRGNHDAAKHYAAQAERVAQRVNTEDARRNGLLARVVARQDHSAATEVLGLTDASDEPFEFARIVMVLAENGLADPKLMRTAYEKLGELDALIPRAQLRTLMRTHNVAVPGRNTTVAENERLLAALVTEGLTNSQVAKVLGTSEKSVEGRLTRLFQRTGYRSRAELATATLRGCADLPA